MDRDEVPIKVRQAIDYALEEVAMERPLDPITFVAEKLLEFEALNSRRLDLRDLFVAFDVDGNGVMSMGEMYQMGRTFCPTGKGGFTNKQMRALFREADRNGDGEVDCDEFIFTMEKTLKGSSDVRFKQGLERALVSRSYLCLTRDHQLREVFDAFDVDKGGVISMHELYKICRVLVPGSGSSAFSNEELRARFDAMDTDKDRQVRGGGEGGGERRAP